MSHFRARSAVVLAAAATAVAGSALPASAAAPYCGQTWGSTAETAGGAGTGTVDDVRAGRHACFDRLVIDLDGVHGDDVGYDVRYVPQFREDATGDVVPLRGAADLQIVVHNPAYDPDGTATYDPANDAEIVGVSGYSTFRQVAWGQSFEGYSTVGLGVRARLPFRVFVLDGPGRDARMVVDVAHRW